MYLTMFAFAMKSAASVGNKGTCWLLSLVLKVSLTQATRESNTQRGHMSRGTMVGAPAMAPQEHLWDREAPIAAWSVLENGNSHETSQLASAVTSVTTALANSMLLQAHHEPAKSARLGHDGPPGQRGSGALSRWCVWRWVWRCGSGSADASVGGLFDLLEG
jgi:hypothetical protein